MTHPLPDKNEQRLLNALREKADELPDAHFQQRGLMHMAADVLMRLLRQAAEKYCVHGTLGGCDFCRLTKPELREEVCEVCGGRVSACRVLGHRPDGDKTVWQRSATLPPAWREAAKDAADYFAQAGSKDKWDWTASKRKELTATLQAMASTDGSDHTKEKA